MEAFVLGIPGKGVHEALVGLPTETEFHAHECSALINSRQLNLRPVMRED
jgi:hypothetical protein